MTDLLILKTGALGDVLRTTSILPGLHERYDDARVVWVTAAAALDLVRHHPLVSQVEAFDPASLESLETLGARLGLVPWERVVSLDDEELCCRLATRLGGRRVTGAYFDEESMTRRYTPDSAAWFDMGLLSTHGKLAADQLKIDNRKSQPQIYAEMLGVPMGKPALPLVGSATLFGEEFARRFDLAGHGPVVGLNTGAGGRWTSKALPVERVVAVCQGVHEALEGRVTFLLLGGREERARNEHLARELDARVRLVDGGTDNSLLDFAALVSQCDLLLTSDSLALHVAVARSVRVVAFFAPTSAAEIELYGLGEKVESTAPDACSYRFDADNSTLTPERLRDAVLRQLGHGGAA